MNKMVFKWMLLWPPAGVLGDGQTEANRRFCVCLLVVALSCSDTSGTEIVQMIFSEALSENKHVN